MDAGIRGGRMPPRRLVLMACFESDFLQPRFPAMSDGVALQLERLPPRAMIADIVTIVVRAFTADPLQRLAELPGLFCVLQMDRFRLHQTKVMGR